jgi:hypothetical protein
MLAGNESNEQSNKSPTFERSVVFHIYERK